MALLDTDGNRDWRALGKRVARFLAYVVLTLAAIGIVGAIGYGLLLFRGLIGATFLVLAFFVGFVFLPLLTFAPLGLTGGEVIGNALFKLATLPGTGAKAINQRVDGVYEWVDIDEEHVHGSRSWWERFVGGRFGLTYDRDPEAFGDLAHTREEVVSRHKQDPEYQADGGGTAALDSERAGIGQFLALDGGRDSIYVNAAEKLSELREAAGLEVSVRARSHGLAEYGGDSSDVSAWAMLAGSFLFLVVGAVLGIIILG
jgi:hypothetical protein